MWLQTKFVLEGRVEVIFIRGVEKGRREVKMDGLIRTRGEIREGKSDTMESMS